MPHPSQFSKWDQSTFSTPNGGYSSSLANLMAAAKQNPNRFEMPGPPHWEQAGGMGQAPAMVSYGQMHGPLTGANGQYIPASPGWKPAGGMAGYGYGLEANPYNPSGLSSSQFNIGMGQNLANARYSPSYMDAMRQYNTQRDQLIREMFGSPSVMFHDLEGNPTGAWDRLQAAMKQRGIVQPDITSYNDWQTGFPTPNKPYPPSGYGQPGMGAFGKPSIGYGGYRMNPIMHNMWAPTVAATTPAATTASQAG